MIGYPGRNDPYWEKARQREGTIKYVIKRTVNVVALGIAALFGGK